jgi:hypothetical protein
MSFSSGMKSMNDNQNAITELVDSSTSEVITNQSQSSQWEYRQLPNVSISGQTTPIFVMDAVVKENDGIYFVIAQSYGYGRFSGDWSVQFGDIQVNVRDYFGTCDSCYFTALAKLDYNGQWEWVKFLNYPSGNTKLSIFEWSSNAVAISGEGIWSDNEYYTGNRSDFVIFSTDGSVVDSFKLKDNGHPDYNSGYVGSFGDKHYFTDLLNEGKNPPHDLQLCLEDSTNVEPFASLFFMYSLDSNLDSALVFSTTAAGYGWQNNVVFSNETFTVHLPYYSAFNAHVSDSHVIHYDGTCTEKYHISGDTELIDNFRSAQGNPNNYYPEFVMVFDPYSQEIKPIALMSQGCVILESVGTHNFAKNQCLVVENVDLRYVILNEEWNWSNEMTILIDLPSNDNRYNGITVILDLNDLEKSELDSLSSQLLAYNVFRPSESIAMARRGYSLSEFYHSGHGLSYNWNDAESGTNMTDNTTQLVSSISFEPFSQLPYGENNVSAWFYFCNCTNDDNTSGNGIYFNWRHYEWEEKINIDYSKFGGVKSLEVSNSYESSNGSFISNVRRDYMIPYIYDPIRGLQGVPIPNEGTVVFFLAKGEIADILSPFTTWLDFGGIVEFPEDPIDTGNGDETCQVHVDTSETSRTCDIPQGDMDWDGLPDEPTNGAQADEDRDGDGKLDIIELSDSMTGTDPDSVDLGIISSPDPNFIHSITAITQENQIEITVEYKMTMSEMMIVLPLIAYFNEDGTPNDMTDYNLNSATELDRLEQKMCDSPKATLLDGSQTIPHWLENFSIDDQNTPFNWECEWEERRSIDLTSFMLIFDASDIANWKETIRYTLILDSFDATSDITTIQMPISNGTTGKVWNLILQSATTEQSFIYHPWIEKGTLVALNPLDEPPEEPIPSIPAVTPTYTNAWSIIVDVKKGSVDCSGFSDSVNEATSLDDLDNLYSQNDIEHSSLSGYHEYPNSDDNIYITCSGNVDFEQAMDGMEDDFCAYLFLYGELKQSKCDSGSFAIITLTGQKTTLEEDLNNFEQDLTDWENQWEKDLDDLFDTSDSSDSSDFDAELDEMIDTVLVPLAILILVIASISAIAKNQQKLREQREAEEDWDEHDIFANQFNSQEDQFDVSYIDTSTDEVGQNEQEHTWPEEVESTHEYKIPNFDFQGDINDEGWEVCEYPRSSDIWWWKDYETGSWVLWE